MGASLSRYPFPMPRPERDSEPPKPGPKLGKWSFNSIMKKSKKGKDREKYSDFIVPKHHAFSSTHPAMSYYYPQMARSAFPAYYAPVQMVVQPIPVQQPVLAMPQGYLPIAAYQTTAAPVQPPIAPAPVIQPITAMQMPVPAPAQSQAPQTVPVPGPAVQMPFPGTGPQPTPVLPLSAAPPPSGSSRMPQPYPASAQTPMHQPYPISGQTPVRPSATTSMPEPHPVRDPTSNQGPVIPIMSSPIPANPVIPPPPMGSEPHRPPDSARPRFTDFYRSADFPQPRRPSFDEPVRPPTAGPAGRTPFAPPASMPTPTPGPGPALRMPTPAASNNNPLPRLPADVWDTLPYRQVLENLPTDVSTLLDMGQRADVLVGEPVPRPSSRLGALFGPTSRKDKGKGPLRGLFRSRSTSVGHEAMPEPMSAGGSRHGHSRSQTMTTIVIPPPGPNSSTLDMPIPSQGPPIKFDHTGKYAGFVNHSNHRVMYMNKMYPTALHLLEAMKFTHEPALQERIRTCKDVNDMYPLSASFQEHVRPDWGQVFLKTMEDVLYLKFKQHPSLRTLLLGTGLATIIYADDNDYWGDGSTGGGSNELGKALVRVRERLRQEGER